jgi:hypothetical protein
VNILYAEIWVSAPRVGHVRPRRESEPLLQVRNAASQPVDGLRKDSAPPSEGLSHSVMAGATPMGFESIPHTVTREGSGTVYWLVRMG